MEILLFHVFFLYVFFVCFFLMGLFKLRQHNPPHLNTRWNGRERAPKRRWGMMRWGRGGAGREEKWGYQRMRASRWLDYIL